MCKILYLILFVIVQLVNASVPTVGSTSKTEAFPKDVKLSQKTVRDLNSVLLNPDEANRFLNKQDKHSSLRRRLEVCPSGTSYEYGFFDDECNP